MHMEPSAAKPWPALAVDLLMKSELSSPEADVNGSVHENDKCWVCGCPANGRHYGVMACFGCKGFFRRSVQGQKNYVCRHERNCVIDQSDRNCCRACRFEKCLLVGMDPAAIQPDRDKTGRQRNPRRSAYARPGSGNGAQQTTLSNGMHFESHPDPPSHPTEMDTSVEGLPTEMDRTIMETLVEIEHICAALKPEISTSYQSLPTAVQKPSTVYSRTSMCFDGHNGPATGSILKDDALRLSVLMLDYVNTLRPLADVGLSDKVAVVRQCLAPFVVLVVGFHTAQRETIEGISLPSGHELQPDQPFLENVEDEKQATLLDIRARCLFRNFIEQVVVPMRRMQITVAEIAAVKAILTLDPNAPGISAESIDLLTSGREAVQRALFASLRAGLPHAGATARFGHLLMVITSVTRIASQLLNLIFQLKEAGMFSDPVITDLFLNAC